MSALRYMMLLVLLFPIGLQAQEVDKQKLLEMLRCPRVSLDADLSADRSGKVRLPSERFALQKEITELKKKLKSEPADWKIWKEIVSNADELGDKQTSKKAEDEEFSCLTKWIAEHPNDLNGLTEHIDLLIGREKIEEALAKALDMVKRFPSESEAWVALKNCHYAKKTFEAGCADFEKAIALAPKNAHLHFEYAVILLALSAQETLGKTKFEFNELIAARLQDERQLLSPPTQSKEKDKNEVIPSTFVPDRAGLTAAEPTPVVPKRIEQIRKILRRAKEEAQLAIKLYRANDPKDGSVLFAITLKQQAEACEDPSQANLQNLNNLMYQGEYLVELARLAECHPDDYSLNAMLFMARLVGTFQRAAQHRPATEFETLKRLKKTFRTLLTPEDNRLLTEPFRFEKAIPSMSPDKAALAHQALIMMHLTLNEFDLAEPHLRRACELAPDDALNWKLLVGILAANGKEKEIPPLRDRILQEHRSADTYSWLVPVSVELKETKLAREYISEGLKLDPKHPSLLLSGIVMDVKADSSPVVLKQALDRLSSLRKLLDDEPKLREKIGKSECYLASIIINALAGHLDQTQSMLEVMLQEEPQNEEFQKLRQILGVAGLQPPNLLKP